MALTVDDDDNDSNLNSNLNLNSNSNLIMPPDWVIFLEGVSQIQLKTIHHFEWYKLLDILQELFVYVYRGKEKYLNRGNTRSGTSYFFFNSDFTKFFCYKNITYIYFRVAPFHEIFASIIQ